MPYLLVSWGRGGCGSCLLPIEIPTVAVGAITAALIAGVVSLLGLIVSKEQKVSDFRQAWIDGLRSEIASLISHANAIHGSSSIRGSNTGSDLADFWKNIHSDYVDLNDAIYKIRLRLNPQESPSLKILRTIDEIEKIIAPARNIDHVTLTSYETRLVQETNTVLKSEWNRVKSGEIVYKVSKYVALIVVISCVVIGTVFAIRGIIEL
jgi:hypothetical protein